MALPAKDADIGMMLIHYHTFTYIYTHTQEQGVRTRRDILGYGTMRRLVVAAFWVPYHNNW